MKQNLIITGSNSLIAIKLSKILKKNIKYTILNTHRGIIKEKIKGIDYINIKNSDNVNFKRQIKNANIIIHCAGSTFAKIKKKKDINKSFKESISFSKKILDYSDLGKKKLFIFLSSGNINPSNETKIDKYVASKLIIENYIKKKAIRGNINYIILRPSHIYGRGMPSKLVIFKKMLSYRLPIIRNFNYNLSLLSIDNLIDVILKCLSNKKIKNKVLYLCDNSDYSFSEISLRYKKITKSKNYEINLPNIFLKILYNFYLKKYYSQLFVSKIDFLKKTKQALNWKPKFNLWNSKL